jgi:hypothetical protein
MGGNPIEAARAVDAQDEATNLAGGSEPAPPPTPVPAAPLKNAVQFDDFTQSLAGTLKAEAEKLRRARADITDQMIEASTARDRRLDDAKAEYDRQVAAAGKDFDAINAALEAKANNAVKALDAIDAASRALTV